MSEVYGPGFGLAPKMLPEVIGKRLRQDVDKNTPLNLNMLENQ